MPPGSPLGCWPTLRRGGASDDRPQPPHPPRGHRLALACAAALLLTACALPRCVHADPAAHPIVQRRVAQAWPEIEVAVDIAGIPPAIFAALLAC